MVPPHGVAHRLVAAARGDAEARVRAVLHEQVEALVHRVVKGTVGVVDVPRTRAHVEHREVRVYGGAVRSVRRGSERAGERQERWPAHSTAAHRAEKRQIALVVGILVPIR